MELILQIIVLTVVLKLKAEATVSPKGTVQYVFNVPTDMEGGYPKEVQAAIANLQEQVTFLSKQIRFIQSSGTINITGGGAGDVFGSGTNYVRWGRKTCPTDNLLIYAGYAAKSYHGHTGGGVNYMCLPNNPQFSDKAVPGHQGNDYIYGVQVHANGISSILDPKHNQHDMTCVWCEAPIRKQTLMIPGKTSCPSNWHLEYDGYIMSSHYTHVNPSTYICVDKDQEFAVRGNADQSSGYALPVEIVCGSIPCPPYKQGYELTCVVCSK